MDAEAEFVVTANASRCRVVTRRIGQREFGQDMFGGPLVILASEARSRASKFATASCPDTRERPVGGLFDSDPQHE